MKKYISVIVLIFIIFNLSSCKKQDEYLDENEKIVIKSGENVLNEVSLDEIKMLKSYKRRVNINSSGGSQVYDFRGALLSDILNEADKSIIEEFSSAQILGADGYFSNVSMEEIRKENKVYIMYEDAGKPLEGLKKSKKSMRLIILGDDFGQRYTNYVVEIRLIK